MKLLLSVVLCASMMQPIKEVPKQWVGTNFTTNEERILQFLQDEGIKDKTALAVILGNIKQESRFKPDICEGGQRIPYALCVSGGYGIIQWTSSDRYAGLGSFANSIGENPSTLDTQLSYMVTERQWKQAKEMFLIPNKNLEYYMNAAKIWLGWGVYGNRGYFSKQYIDLLTKG